MATQFGEPVGVAGVAQPAGLTSLLVAAAYYCAPEVLDGHYAEHCDRVDQVRTLRQLETFVEAAALGPRPVG